MIKGTHLLVDSAYSRTHRLILSFLQKRSDEQLSWRLNPATHPIAFHAWHIARWADHLQAAIPGMTPTLSQRLGTGAQLWIADSLAEEWGFEAARLGFDQTGMGMADADALRLNFPAKGVLLAYVERTIALAEQAVHAVNADEFEQPEQSQPMTAGIWGGGTVGSSILAHVTHANRHLGMMECLLGLQGQPGTATQ